MWLPDFPLTGPGAAARAARAAGLRTFREAAEHTWRLAYGRNSDRADPLLVLREGRGTCSTKHAFLAMLAREHGKEVQLTLGIYLMSEANTPGVGAVLAAAGLDAIPEAHCYLVASGRRIDLTHPPSALPGEPIEAFLAEQAISPEHIGGFKQSWHRSFLGNWVASGTAPPGMTAEAAWAVREACIGALEQCEAR
jgi:hypothetical protein